jgi:hypothetical protein
LQPSSKVDPLKTVEQQNVASQQPSLGGELLLTSVWLIMLMTALAPESGHWLHQLKGAAVLL